MYVLCFTASFRFDGLFRVRMAIFLLEKVSWFFECIKVRATSTTPPTKWWFRSIDRSSTKWWFPSYLALRILLNCSRSTKEHFTLPRSRETSFSSSFSSEKASASWSLQTNRWAIAVCGMHWEWTWGTSASTLLITGFTRLGGAFVSLCCFGLVLARPSPNKLICQHVLLLVCCLVKTKYWSRVIHAEDLILSPNRNAFGAINDVHCYTLLLVIKAS